MTRDPEHCSALYMMNSVCLPDSELTGLAAEMDPLVICKSMETVPLGTTNYNFATFLANMYSILV